jgi:hypothetical protein
MGISWRRLFLLLAIGSLTGASSAVADPPVWDPAGSAQGLAATAQNVAANAGAFTETTTATNCVTNASGPVSPTPPPDDPFYKPPAKIPAGAPGKVIRTRPTCIGDAHIPVPYRAWLVMYVTTAAEDHKGKPSELHAVRSVATGLIIAPLNRGPSVRRPLAVWATAEDSNSTLGAPSYQLSIGASVDNQAIASMLTQGWAVLAPDYEGPDSAFSAGSLEGHAVLDGIRAAENLSSLTGLDGRSTPVGMWGGSGGAIATAWATELQPRYAPELNPAGVIEVDVPADIRAVFNAINDGYVGPGVAFAATLGINTAYPDLVPMSLFNDAGRQLAAVFRATGTNQYPSAVPPQHIEMYTACGCNPVKLPDRFPGVAKATRTVDLGQHIPTAPIMVNQSWNDELVPYAGVARLVKTYCDGGATVDFRVNMGNEHISNGDMASPETIAYLAARFDGATPVNTCSLPDNGGVTPPVDPVPIPPPLPVGGPAG